MFALRDFLCSSESWGLDGSSFNLRPIESIEHGLREVGWDGADVLFELVEVDREVLFCAGHGGCRRQERAWGGRPWWEALLGAVTSWTSSPHWPRPSARARACSSRACRPRRITSASPTTHLATFTSRRTLARSPLFQSRGRRRCKRVCAGPVRRADMRSRWNVLPGHLSTARPIPLRPSPPRASARNPDWENIAESG